MTNISWDNATEVADAHAAIAAAEACEAETLLLRTEEGGLFTLGSRYWLAVGTKLIRSFPNLEVVIIVDAGGDSGIAMGAIADGQKAVRWTGDKETFEKLTQSGRDNGTVVVGNELAHTAPRLW